MGWGLSGGKSSFFAVVFLGEVADFVAGDGGEESPELVFGMGVVESAVGGALDEGCEGIERGVEFVFDCVGRVGIEEGTREGGEAAVVAFPEVLDGVGIA